MRFLLLIGFFGLIPLELEPAAPWQRESSRALAPWLRDGGSSERKQRRDQFFRSLNLTSDISHDSTEELQEIQSLPWARFKEEWTRPITGEFLWPVNGGRISSGYGPRRGSFHEGLDIAGREGQVIRATHDGRVVFSGSLRGYGHTVVVYHGQGLSSVYAHNRENLVRESQIVQRGQSIATLGRSGSATGPHLHFELRREGRSLNPLTYEFDREQGSGHLSAR